MAGRLLLILVVCVSGLAAQAPAPLAGVERVASVEGITEYRLSNGLRVLLIPDPSKSTTTVNLTRRKRSLPRCDGIWTSVN